MNCGAVGCSHMATRRDVDHADARREAAADAPTDAPLAWRELVRVHGLARRTDLNNRIAEAHGRVKANAADREGVTMLLGAERVWIRRRNLQSLPTAALLHAACDAHGVDDAERHDAVLQLGVEAHRVNKVLDENGHAVGGLYSTC